NCYDLARRQKRHQAAPLPKTIDATDMSASDDLGAVELRPDLEAALSRLPDDFRAAVVLADAEGLPLDTVAETLGVPIGTVKSRVFRGRRLLAQALGNFRDASELPRDEHHA
ncbi:MAG: sigma factor-like helix-turn-helix DNA-binding protein, partial [Acidimicrobiia bacterium]